MRLGGSIPKAYTTAEAWAEDCRRAGYYACTCPINHEASAEEKKHLLEVAEKNNILIIQAHPMRNSMTVMNPDYLDGYEVYNGNMRHNSRNAIADAWAELNCKIKVSGSDFHQLEDLARGGVYFDNYVESTQQLVQELIKGRYKIKTT
jgi:hypothetical protein